MPLEILLIATSLASTAVEGILGNRADGYFCNFVNQINNKLRRNTQKENQQLSKAFTLSCLNATRHICSQLNRNISGDNLLSITTRTKNRLLGEIPVGVFSHNEKEWLTKANAYLKNRISEIDKNLVYLPETQKEQYQSFLSPKRITSIERAEEFKRLFTEDTINELRKAFKEEPPEKFIEAMEKYWFNLACDEFQDSINQNQLLTNIFQNNTLAEISIDTNIIKIQLSNIFNFLPELIRQAEENVGKKLDDVKAELLDAFNKDKIEQNSARAVFNLPNLRAVVYDRESEAQEILRVMCEESERFWIVVAPSAFGKSYLLTKFLQQVINQSGTIKSEYQTKVQHIILIDCRITKTITQIVTDFSELLGLSLQYVLQKGETAQGWLNKHLFPHIQRSGTIWLILENFESWLDADNKHSLRDAEMREFFNALFNGNHNLRVLILSQSEPISDLRKKLKSLKTVGENLFKGLPEKDALQYLRTEGAEVGLDKANEKLLKEFLARVYHIPQALSSLIGYLYTVGGQGFERLMEDEEFWKGFDEYENDPKEGERRTKALISKQISAQSEEVKWLLMAIAFFGEKISQDVLEFLFHDKVQAAQAINQLAYNRLAEVSLDSRNTRYYELHAYFQEQTQKTLPFFGNFVDEKLAIELHAEASKLVENAFYIKALNLLQCASLVYSFLNFKGQPIIGNIYFGVLTDKALITQEIGKINEAIDQYTKIISDLKHLKIEELEDALAMNYLNKAEALRKIGKLENSLEESNHSLQLLEKLVYKKNRKEFTELLAIGYSNKGITLSDSGWLSKNISSLNDAMSLFAKSMQILEPLYEKHQLKDKVALASSYRSNATTIDRHNILKNDFNRSEEAINFYQKSLAVLEALNSESLEITYQMGMIYVNIGASYERVDKLPESRDYYTRGIDRWNTCVENGWIQILPELLLGLHNRFIINLKLDDFAEAAKDLSQANNFDIYFENPEVTDFHKERMDEIFSQMISLIRGLPEESREKLYKFCPPDIQEHLEKTEIDSGL